MENEVVIHVRAEDDTEKGFAQARLGAKKLGEDLERELGKAGKKAGRALGDGIADGLRQHHQIIVQRARAIGDDVEDVLDRAGHRAGIELGQGVQDGFGIHRPDIEAGAVSLGASIETEMGDAGERAGKALGDGIRKGTAGSGGGEGLGEKLVPTLGKAGIKAGAAAASGIMSGIEDGLGGAIKGEKLIAAATAAGLTLSPLLGGLLAAAVVGTAGGLGIVGGLAAASMDPRVKGAAAAIKDTIQDDLKEAVKPFVPSVVSAIGRARAAFTGMLPDIESIFRKAGPLMDPLFDGILDGVARLVSAIDDTMGQAGPVFEALGRLFENTGEQLGEVFTDLADNSDDAAKAIDLFSATLGVVLDASTAVIEALTTVGGFIDDQITGWQQLDDNVLKWTDGLWGLADGTGGVSLKNAEWRDSASDAADAVYDQVEAIRTLEAEMRNQTDPLMTVIDMQAQLKTAQDRYSKAVKENGEDSGKAKKALADLGKAGFNLTEAMSDAASQGFNGKLSPAMRAMLKAAGLSKVEIGKLEKELIEAWKASEKWATTYVAKYVVKYSSSGSKEGDFGEGGNFSGVGGLAHGGISGAANGAMSSGLTMVGESGPELVKLPAGTQVSSNPDTKRQLGRSLGGERSTATADRMFITFDPSGTHKLTRALMEALRAEIRNDGGNVQTVLGVN